MKHIGDISIPKITSLYSHVPIERMRDFQAFCQDFPYHEVTHDGITWSYMRSDQGDPPLVLLSGALAIPDISWTTIVSLATRQRLIVPAYPAVMTMDSLVDGIAAILRHEGIERAQVMGGSYGGFVAQVFVRRYPQLTQSLVLSHTLPPYPETATRLRPFVTLIRWMPMGLVRQLMRRVFRSMMPEWSEETAITLAIFNELIADTLNKRDVIAILERTIDYSAHTFEPDDLTAWSGKVLLVFGEDDPATPPEVRQRLQALYPGCQVHLFEGAGHAISLTHQQEYLNKIDAFLSQVYIDNDERANYMQSHI